MRLFRSPGILALSVVAASVWAQQPIEQMDERAGWMVAGEGIAVERVGAEQAPAGVEGAGAIRCALA